MLLIFQLGRPDVLPVDDFGLRNGFRVAYRRPTMPTPKQLLQYGERWKTLPDGCRLVPLAGGGWPGKAAVWKSTDNLMADPNKRLDSNVPGNFYVDATCINCDTCRQLAPLSFEEVGDIPRVSLSRRVNRVSSSLPGIARLSRRLDRH